MTDIVDKLIEVAAEAAEVIRKVYETRFDVAYKAPRDPVTEADHRANALICQRLRAEFPGIPVVAEESDPATFAGFRAAERVFFVDPLDGTQEFVDRNGEFVVMLGLLEGERAAAGIVHAPASDTVWAGAIGYGAYRIDRNGRREALRTSETRTLSAARVVASRSHRSRALEQVLDAMGPRKLIPLGSAGLKGAQIAMGHADVYVAPGHAGQRWDSCAVDALVTAAGGQYTDARGRPIDYRAENLVNDQGVLATNGLLHEPALRALEMALR